MHRTEKLTEQCLLCHYIRKKVSFYNISTVIPYNVQLSVLYPDQQKQS